MTQKTRTARWFLIAATALTIVASATYVGSHRPPTLVIAVELICLTLGCFYAAVRPRIVQRDSFPIRLLETGAMVVLVMIALLVAAPWVPHPALVSLGIWAVILLSLDAAKSPRIYHVGSAMVMAGFVVTWWISGFIHDEGADVFLIAAAYLVALQLVNHGLAMGSLGRSEVLSLRLHAMAMTAREIGVANETNEVVAAVLRTAKTLFPDSTDGAVLLHDRCANVLRTVPIWLYADRIGAAENEGVVMRTDEGLTGFVFRAQEAKLWPTHRDIESAYTTVSPLTATNRAKLGTRLGKTVKSMIAAPLSSPEHGVIGVLSLLSYTRERVWGNDDLILVQGLADAAGLAIERARRTEERLEHAASDALTGLSNRRRLQQQLDMEISRAKRNHNTIGILFVDLDNLKLINDNYGHDAGDRALCLLADTFSVVLRQEDVAGRHGGDEFVCVLPGADMEHCQSAVQRIQDRFRQTLQNDIALSPLNTGVSVGIAVFPEDGETSDSVIVAADKRLLAQRSRRNVTLRGIASRNPQPVDVEFR